MRPDMRTPDAAVSHPLGNSLGGADSVRFDQGDLQVQVGWLRVGGDGLVVTARVDRGPVGELRFWCDTQQWCDWLAPWLPVPSFDVLPQAWHEIAMSLTFADGRDVEDDDDDEGGALALADSWPSATQLTRGTATVDWRIGIVLQREGKRLALAWLTREDAQEKASAWLRERCARAAPCAQPLDPAGVPQRHGLLVAGWTDISGEQWGALGGGDAVMLDKWADVASGAYWVIDGDYALAYPGNGPSTRGAVARPEVLRLDGPCEASEGLATARVFAVLTTRPFPVPMLDAWRAGQLPDTFARGASRGGTSSCTEPALHMTHVTLWRNDIPCGAGRLLRFDDGRLAVCLDGEDDKSITGHDNPQRLTNSGGDPMGVHPLTP
ncbi:hypothetical protein ACPWR0_22310 [Pandoraea pneumonica]|uniref:hypothetical protein n=1 Tax=Pandoraea pneumonica TaxID=2508299 RepID=UPI003CF8EB92